MRPGAPLAPFCVWQLLQLPLVCPVVMTRSRPWNVTRAVMGNLTAAVEKKLPAALTVIVAIARAVVSNTVTTAPLKRLLTQSFGSCAVGNTVPAIV